MGQDPNQECREPRVFLRIDTARSLLWISFLNVEELGERLAVLVTVGHGRYREDDGRSRPSIRRWAQLVDVA